MNQVEVYISEFNPEIQLRLRELRKLFLDTLPQIEESISYNMPAYKVGTHYLYFAAYKKHIGFYPINGLLEMENELKPYRAKGTKDTLHFSHDKVIPFELIEKIIKLKSAI
jgi:uncharacterized protein YdhG (YjbR/CyaY superfamily)